MDLWSAITGHLTNPATYQGRFALQNLVAQHLYLVTVATIVAAAIAIPLGLWIGHRGRGELAIVAIANSGRAVPDFGIILIAFIAFGLTNTPVLIALVALAIPPIVVNTFVGVRHVDANAKDAAYGAGMTGRQVLWQIEIPLAIPLVMAGLRTAAVQVVATATLAGYVGGGGLGRMVFDGLAAGVTRGDPPPGLARVVIGSVLVALLAIAMEVSLGRLERALTPAGVGSERRASEEPAEPSRPELTGRVAA